MKVAVIKSRRFNTVHIWDEDDREVVVKQKDLPQLIMILKKAARAKGIPFEEFWAKGGLP